VTDLPPVVQIARYTVNCMPADSSPDAHIFGIHVDRKRDGTWAVTDGHRYLDAEGEWSNPLGYLSPKYRHTLDAALALAKAAAPHIRINGLTPAEALARIARINAEEE
jgi:hypothetical protein